LLLLARFYVKASRTSIGGGLMPGHNPGKGTAIIARARPALLSDDFCFNPCHEFRIGKVALQKA
jgi:hypothetical protein